MWEKLVADFYQNFIEDNRWKYITDGLQNTLKITFFAVLIGIVLGFLVAIIRSTYENTHRLKILNAVCSVYLTVIRGTPVVVQLMIDRSIPISFNSTGTGPCPGSMIKVNIRQMAILLIDPFYDLPSEGLIR